MVTTGWLVKKFDQLGDARLPGVDSATAVRERKRLGSLGPNDLHQKGAGRPTPRPGLWTTHPKQPHRSHRPSDRPLQRVPHEQQREHIQPPGAASSRSVAKHTHPLCLVTLASAASTALAHTHALSTLPDGDSHSRATARGVHATARADTFKATAPYLTHARTGCGFGVFVSGSESSSSSAAVSDVGVMPRIAASSARSPIRRSTCSAYRLLVPMSLPRSSVRPRTPDARPSHRHRARLVGASHPGVVFLRMQLARSPRSAVS